MEICSSYSLCLPQSFINQKRKETEDEDAAESFMKKHEQKIRHFGKCTFSNFSGSNLYELLEGLLIKEQNRC